MKYLKTSLLAASLFCTFAQADETESGPAPLQAPATNVFAVLSNQGIASSLRLKDLDKQWRMMRMVNAPEETALLRALSGRGNASTSPWDDLYYTRGDVISMGAQTYLVAYRALPPASLQERRLQQQFIEAWQNEDDDTGGNMVKTVTPPLDENTLLALSLVAIGRNTSLNNIRAFDPAKDVMTGKDKAARKVKIERRLSQSNLKQVGLAVMQFIQDNDEIYPAMRAARSVKDFSENMDDYPFLPTTPVQAMLMPYVRNTDVFLHPATGRPYLPNYKISRMNLSEIEDSAGTFLFFEDAPDAEGMRNVAFVDGHVKAFKEAEFQRLRKAQGISESGLPSPAAKVKPKAKPISGKRGSGSAGRAMPRPTPMRKPRVRPTPMPTPANPRRIGSTDTSGSY